MHLIKSSWVNFSIEWVSSNSLFVKFFLPALLARGLVLNKDPTAWLDGAWLANKCIPPWEMCLSSWAAYPPQKFFFIKTKIRERVWEAHFLQQWVHQMRNLTFSPVLQTPYLNFQISSFLDKKVLVSENSLKGLSFFQKKSFKY